MVSLPFRPAPLISSQKCPTKSDKKKNYFRYVTVQKTLLKDNAVFTFEDGSDSQMFGLVTNDLTQIKPNYEAMIKGGTLRITDEGYAQGNLFFFFRFFDSRNNFLVFMFEIFSLFQFNKINYRKLNASLFHQTQKFSN